MTDTLGVLAMLDGALDRGKITITCEPDLTSGSSNADMDTLYFVVIEGMGERVIWHDRNLGVAIQNATERWALLA